MHYDQFFEQPNSSHQDHRPRVVIRGSDEQAYQAPAPFVASASPSFRSHYAGRDLR
ncbi:hypothetical protein SNOG_07491 [Parastagonospora nodorum SN15]|uniref:BTB domain-containing protein n=1 Tax=Phaeosphaeria nodorum (strain SN15 / ATCC MYA-4574 / FGSC 10173) TaxID=321614 RepID=Q0UL73_PHANO|nr:hypothetical protein SNOG_07491 [Parastagonospora nodorum SN15]EAT84957.1 hypothetical protein SNOG_07491 [Parastagonospora nodorum SN15]